MTEPLYVARTTIRKVSGVRRWAHLPTGATADMGVHGPIRRHFDIQDGTPDLPLPVDFVVAATGA